MFTARQFVILAAFGLVASSAFGQISERTLKRLTPQDKQAIEITRNNLLEIDEIGEDSSIPWTDKRGRTRGELKIEKRFYHKESLLYCIQYLLTIDREAEQKLACYEQGKWKDTAIEAAKLDEAEAIRAVGPEYRDRPELLNMVAPKILAKVVQQYKHYENHFHKWSGKDRENTNKEMIKFFKKDMIENMNKPGKKLFIGLHQVAIILKVFQPYINGRKNTTRDVEATRLLILEMLSEGKVIKPIGEPELLIVRLFTSEENQKTALRHVQAATN